MLRYRNERKHWQCTDSFGFHRWEDTSDTWHCFCLVSNVCTSVKALTACVCEQQSAVCVHQSCLINNRYYSKSISLHNKHTKCITRYRAKKTIISFRKYEAFSIFYCPPFHSLNSKRQHLKMEMDLGSSLKIQFSVLCVYHFSLVSIILRQQLLLKA